MPRTARSTEAGMVYHVLNRGNGRMRIFRKPEDFGAFERELADGLLHYAVELFNRKLNDERLEELRTSIQ
jgi:putative transposase